MMEDQKRIFSKNLKRLIDKNEKTQAEIAKEIGILPQTLNTWTQGIAIPRMGSVQMLADYFKVPKSALLEEVPVPSISSRDGSGEVLPPLTA